MKKIITIMIIAAILTSNSVFAEEMQNEGNKDNSLDIFTYVESLQKEDLIKLRDKVNSLITGYDSSKTEEVEEETTVETPFALNEVVTNEYCEFSILEEFICSQFSTVDSNGYEHIYKADDGKQYLIFGGYIKGLWNTDLYIGNVKSEILFDDTYRYDMAFNIDKGDGFITNFQSIKPFEVKHLIIMVQLPIEMINNFYNAKLTIAYNKEFNGSFDDISTYDYIYTMETNKEFIDYK